MKFRFPDIFTRTPSVLLALAFIALLATAIPYGVVRAKAGDTWTGVTPSLSYDALRYFARANDVMRGNVQPHNPYFIEYKEVASPTPSWNDALVALPQVLGLSFNGAYYVNIFIWGLLFLLLAYALLRQHRVGVVISFLGAVWVYVGEYGDMLRPGAMQIVYPLYLLFLVLFYRFILGKPKSILPLAVVAGLSVYFYIYLFMTSFVVMGVCALVATMEKKWGEMRRALFAIALSALVALPHIAHVMHIATLDFYEETMERIVFLPSRWPQIEAYYYGRWVVLGMIIIFLIRRYFGEYLEKTTALFFQCTGLGILITMASNVVLGHDFDIAVHVGRFGVVWYLLLGIVLCAPLVAIWRKEKRVFIKKVSVTLLFVLLVLQMFLNIQRALPIFYLTNEEVREVQEYNGVIEWLKKEPPAVVLADEKLMAYIPTLTKQYVLYTNQAGLFLLGNQELNERLLLTHAFDRWTSEEFVTRSQGHQGPVPDLQAKTERLRFQICTFFLRDTSCRSPKSIWDFIDTASLQTQYDTYYPELPNRVITEYQRYHVRYIVFRTGETLPEEVATDCAPAYADRFYSACVFSASR